MDDLDFADMLYQGWAKTTHAEDSFWGFDEESWDSDTSKGTIYQLFYITESDGEKHVIGELYAEEDAGFITALHGCFGDLIKRWHEAIETAERMEIERDNVVAELGQAYIEIDELKAGRA